MGVLEALERHRPLRLKGVAISSYEKEEFVVEYPPRPGHPRGMSSLSLPRTLLDSLLLDQVVRAGVEVRQKHKVTDFLFEGGNVAGVRGRDAQGRAFSFRARMVVDAGGRNAIALRRFHLKRRSRYAGKIALAAHWDGVTLPGPYCHMHISRPGYTGLAPVGNRRANVVLVVPDSCLRGEKDRHRFYVRAVLKNRRRRIFLENAKPVEPVRGVGALAFEVKPVPCGGLILVGDATGFLDPFTGEGIYLSLRSAQMAAEEIDGALRDGDVSRRRLSGYDRKRGQEFEEKFRLSKCLQHLLYHPARCNWVVRRLAENPDLARDLVGVIGDYLPAKKVVSWGYVFRLVAGKTRRRERDKRMIPFSLPPGFKE